MTTAEKLVAALRAGRMTCATAESCTGGGVGSAITAVSGASSVFRGGIISYDNEIKCRILGVEQRIIDKEGPISQACAEQMAVGARRLLATNFAVAVTGLAGPGGDGVHPAGCVWFAVASDAGVVAENVVFPGDRAAVRAAAVEHALQMILENIETP